MDSSEIIDDVPKIKLLTFWKRDREYEKDICKHFISHGIWQTIEVKNLEKQWRVYKFRCVMPMHQDLELYSERIMPECAILQMCHPVSIIDLPKINQLKTDRKYMDASVEGALEQIDRSWKCFVHRDKPMTKPQVKAVLEYALQVGYESTSELKDSEIDDIIDKVNKGRFTSVTTINQSKLL
jgi:hypothetical protein